MPVTLTYNEISFPALNSIDVIVDVSEAMDKKQVNLDLLSEKITLAFEVKLVTKNPIGYNQLEDYSYGCFFNTREKSLAIINMGLLRTTNCDDYSEIVSIVFRLANEAVKQNINLKIHLSD